MNIKKKNNGTKEMEEKNRIQLDKIKIQITLTGQNAEHLEHGEFFSFEE
jgi:hypothetical protein